jgi:hypothetical protein
MIKSVIFIVERFNGQVMKRREFIRGTAMASLVLSHFGCSAWEGYIRIINRAGNMSDHGDRFLLLAGLRESGKVPQAHGQDLEIILPYAREWAHNSQSAEIIEDLMLKRNYLHHYFHARIRSGELGPDKTDEIHGTSPFYPLYCMYAGLALVYYTIQISDIRLVPPIRDKWYGKGRELLRIARRAFPGNESLGIYFNEPVPWKLDLSPDPDAPAWANIQRASLLKLQQVIHWWIEHRQLKEGTYGGGLNDDCEMWRMWKAVLIGYEDKRAISAQEKLTRVTLDRPEMELGFTSRMTDVEHSSEETSDVITPLMHLFPGRPDWAERTRKIFKLAKDHWSGYNERGFLQFKTSYLSSTDMDMAPHRACDTIYHFRVMQPVLLYWQRTDDGEMGEWFLKWLDTWVDAAMSTARGKPQGIIPTAIHWPDGNPGGVNEEWWKPGNYSSPIYDWPRFTDIIYETLVLAYHKSGNKRYLEPLRESVRLRREFIQTQGQAGTEWEPGSKPWCASRLGEVIHVALLKYRIISGDTAYDDLLVKDADGFANLQLTGDPDRFTAELDRLSDAFRFNKAVYTVDVRHTDRVFAFPDYYLGYFYEFASARRLAGLLYQSVTGDPGHWSYFPLEAISWKSDVGNLASVVTLNREDRLEVMIYNFTGRRAHIIRTKLLKPGNYALEITDRSTAEIYRSTVSIAGPGSELELELIPRREQKLMLALI